MLQKKHLGGKRYQVTFTMPPIEGVATLHLCGEFNGWSDTSTPMRREPDGSWSATLSLDGGKSYMFRYRDQHGAWHNDWGADAYVPNQFGSENSVLDLAAQDAAVPRAEEPAGQKNRRPSGPRRPAGRSGPQKKRRS